MARQFKADGLRRTVDKIVKFFLVRRMGPPGLYLLTTRGRKTGREHSTPVSLVEDGGKRWLVAPYGPVDWVLNARAAGQVTLTRHGRVEQAGIRELPAGEAGPVLRKYLAATPIVQPFFDARPESSEADFTAEAPKHPVFELAPQ